MEPASLPDPAPPEKAVRISSHNSQRRYMSYQHTICFPVQAKRQHETHTHTHVHDASDVVSDLTPAFTFSLITSGLCVCVCVCRSSKSSLCLQDFRMIAVLGRGHFGKVTGICSVSKVLTAASQSAESPHTEKSYILYCICISIWIS